MNQTKRGAMSRLPVEILGNILLRLPVKFLGQSKCVCKTWRSLISDPHFVKSHLNRAISGSSNADRLRIFTVYPFHSLDYESPSSFEDVDDDDALVDLGFPAREPDHGIEIVGSCNGLICLLYYPDCFILWNPTIRESRELPPPPPLSSSVDGAVPFRGFGYRSSTDDYKVVRANPMDNSNQLTVEVFSLKDNSWRRIEGLREDTLITEEVGTYLNGSLHWLSSYGADSSKEVRIVSFDLEELEFGEISQPDLDNKSIRFHTLASINGCLSLLSFDGGLRDVGVWVMKEYGTITSWTRLLVLPQDEFLSCGYLVPVCFAKNGDVIIDVDGEILVRYNPREKTTRNLKNRSEDCFEWLLYVESLVSPNHLCVR